MSSHAAPHPLHRPLIALVAALLLLGTLLVAPSAHAEEVLEVEPNNSTAAAQVLPLGATVTGALVSDSSCGAACDYYRFSAPGQGRLRLDLRFASTLGTQGQLRVTVADAQGRERAPGELLHGFETVLPHPEPVARFLVLVLMSSSHIRGIWDSRSGGLAGSLFL